jgi:hypothetical protein
LTLVAAVDSPEADSLSLLSDWSWQLEDVIAAKEHGSKTPFSKIVGEFGDGNSANCNDMVSQKPSILPKWWLMVGTMATSVVSGGRAKSKTEIGGTRRGSTLPKCVTYRLWKPIAKLAAQHGGYSAAEQALRRRAMEREWYLQGGKIVSMDRLGAW